MFDSVHAVPGQQSLTPVHLVPGVRHARTHAPFAQVAPAQHGEKSPQGYGLPSGRHSAA